MKHLVPGIFLILVLGCMVSCDNKRVFDVYTTLPGAVWDSDSVLSYTFSVGQTGQNHNILFNLRNDRNYPFSNLWLFVTILPPQGEFLTDTIEVALADPVGRWLGKGIGGVYDNRLTYRRNVFFPLPGDYTIEIRHGMRLKKLEGITDVGIRIEKN